MRVQDLDKQSANLRSKPANDSTAVKQEDPLTNYQVNSKAAMSPKKPEPGGKHESSSSLFLSNKLPRQG